MSVYFDSSAVVKRYLAEPGRNVVDAALAATTQPVTSDLTIVEVRRALGRIKSPVERVGAKVVFEHDLQAFVVVRLDAEVIEQAAAIAETTALRSLDVLHLAAAVTVGCSTLASFDQRRRDVAAGFGLGLVPRVRE